MTVLVADDEYDVREVCRYILESNGFEVLEAESGEQAKLLLAASESISLLITDVLMPGLTGVELVEAVMPQRPRMRVLYISGYAAESGLMVKHIQQWGCGFLQKPFRPAELISQVRALLAPPGTITASQRAPRNQSSLRIRPRFVPGASASFEVENLPLRGRTNAAVRERERAWNLLVHACHRFAAEYARTLEIWPFRR